MSCEPGVRGAPVRGPARVLFGLGIDPNRADASTLEALPGIGPARAAAIVAGRENGAYRSTADLGRVRGIGPVTLRRIASWLAFDAAEQAPGGTGSLPRSAPRKAAKRPRSDAKPSEAWAPAKEGIGRMPP